jgi:hypothetical protein
MPGKQQPKSVADIARELWELTQAYAKQETIDPLKNLGRYLGFGLAGSLFVSLGGALLSLGLLRLLQTVDAFDGAWSFVPYLLVLVVLAVALGLLGRSISRAFPSSGPPSTDPPSADRATAGPAGATIVTASGEAR